MDVVAGERRDHLIRVHVRRGAQPVWKTSIGNWSSSFACGDAVGGGCDALGLVSVEQAQLGVHTGGSGLDSAEPAGDGGRDRPPGDGEILDRLPRLGPPELVLHGHAASLVMSQCLTLRCANSVPMHLQAGRLFGAASCLEQRLPAVSFILGRPCGSPAARSAASIASQPA